MKNQKSSLKQRVFFFTNPPKKFCVIKKEEVYGSIFRHESGYDYWYFLGSGEDLIEELKKKGIPQDDFNN